MFDEILFPTDGSDGAIAALDHVLAIAKRHGATVHLLNVADTTRDSLVRIEGEVVDVLEQEGTTVVEATAERAREHGVSTLSEVRQGEPYRTIVEYADTRAVDVIVMPTHGRSGLERLLLGSTTERVLRRADQPVLTIRPDADVEYPYRNVLVPTDGSDCAAAALEMGIDVVTMEEASLEILSVVDVTSLGVDGRSDLQATILEESAEEIVEEATATAEAAGLTSVTGTVKHGSSIHRTVLSYLEEHDVDLVVVGTHGRTGFDRYLLGSVTEALIRTAPVPVLTVRNPEADSNAT